MGKHLKPILNHFYGCYKVISEEVFKIKDKNREHYRGYFKVECIKCNTEHLIRADILKSGQAKQCRACSNKEKYLQNKKDKKIAFKGYSVSHQGTGDFTKTQLFRIKMSAKKRKIYWDDKYMTTENLWDLLKQQDNRCKLSGLPIHLSKGDNIPLTTNHSNLDYSGWNASLDRIDSSKGYIEDNLQWLHRNINIMKNSYPQNYFIELCELVTFKNKNNE